MPHQMDDHHRSVDFFEALHNFEEKNKALHIHGKNANFYWGRCCIFMKKITSVGQRRCLIMAKKAVKLALKFSHAHISSITLSTGHPIQPVSSLLAGVCQREKQIQSARTVGNVLWTSRLKSFALDAVYRNV